MDNNKHLEIKDDIKNTFDNVAQKYDSNQQFIISARGTVEKINIDGKNINILDLSSGTGNIAIELGKKFPDAKIYGVDISNEMLNIARRKTKEQNLKNISYQVQDVENLDFPDIKFDIITCGYGLFFYPNMDKVLCDVCTMLKDDGKFVFSTFNEDAFQPYSKIFLDMLEKNYGITYPESMERRLLKTRNEIQEFVGQVENTKIEIHDLGIRFSMTIDQWWELVNSTSFKGLLNQLGENYEKFENEYKQHLKLLSKDNTINYNADSLISVVSM